MGRRGGLTLVTLLIGEWLRREGGLKHAVVKEEVDRRKERRRVGLSEVDFE